MKNNLGSKLWLHTDGEPEEIVISSHGYRDLDTPAMFSLANFKEGTTLYFMVPDGDPSVVNLNQVVYGQGTQLYKHTTTENAMVYEYYLQKFQKSSHSRRENRHAPDGDASALESYSTIAQSVTSQKNYSEPGPLHDWRQKEINKWGNDQTTSAGDFKKRGVITVRSGGPYSQQAVRLSDVIRLAQTPPYDYRIFWCNFCRSYASA